MWVKETQSYFFSVILCFKGIGYPQICTDTNSVNLCTQMWQDLGIEVFSLHTMIIDLCTLWYLKSKSGFLHGKRKPLPLQLKYFQNLDKKIKEYIYIYI